MKIKAKYKRIEAAELKKLVEKSESTNDLVYLLGYKSSSGKLRGLLKTYLKEVGIEEPNSWKEQMGGKRPPKSKQEVLKNVFKKGVRKDGSSLKGWISRFELKVSGGSKTECAICQQSNIWNGKPLTLQLDHINGISDDNRLENLRFLCPHCHSQTETFAGRNTQKPKNYCKDCNTEITRRSNKCIPCHGKSEENIKKRRKFYVSKEDLADLVCVQKIWFTTLGKKFGVSDNAIRKRCRCFGIDPKARVVL